MNEDVETVARILVACYEAGGADAPNEDARFGEPDEEDYALARRILAALSSEPSTSPPSDERVDLVASALYDFIITHDPVAQSRRDDYWGDLARVAIDAAQPSTSEAEAIARDLANEQPCYHDPHEDRDGWSCLTCGVHIIGVDYTQNEELHENDCVWKRARDYLATRGDA